MHPQGRGRSLRHRPGEDQRRLSGMRRGIPEESRSGRDRGFAPTAKSAAPLHPPGRHHRAAQEPRTHRPRPRVTTRRHRPCGSGTGTSRLPPQSGADSRGIRRAPQGPLPRGTRRRRHTAPEPGS